MIYELKHHYADAVIVKHVRAIDYRCTLGKFRRNLNL